MRYSIVMATLAILLPIHSWADTTICKVSDEIGAIKAISWDSESRSASVKDSLGNEHKGKVTHSRKHSEMGEKVNIYIVYDEPFYGSDSSEFIVFPVNNSHRVIGVSYIIRNGEKHLDISNGNYSATCLSM
ncbi:hypothetical protein [Vibrio sp. CyArs1]|uniref:hypothetical protein n=1 Tax=Vibrio sp. CyArs1 TaxID=2682577 RepID=UPI001F06FD8F|nr:hypothetical protein [Vibrio sp. CyArs1]